MITLQNVCVRTHRHTHAHTRTHAHTLTYTQTHTHSIRMTLNKTGVTREDVGQSKINLLLGDFPPAALEGL